MSSRSASFRLLFVAHRFQPNDGQGRVNLEVARALLRKGYQLTLLTAYCIEEIASHPGVKLVLIGREKLPTQLLRNLAFANQSAAWIRAHRHEFDLVQANGFITWEPCDIVTAHFVHSAWARNPFYPFSRWFSPYDIYQRAYTRLNSRWERRAFRSARQIIAVSEVVAHDIESMGVPRERITVIYNGVNTEEFSPGPADRPAFKLPMDVPLALFVGDIRSPRKNIETLLRATSLLPGLHLAVAGDVEGSSAPGKAASLGIADRVHFLGKISRIPALMRCCDMFVFPSRYEAHPLVVLEAMASGMPMVLSRNIESVGSFQDIFMVLEDPGDADGLAAWMKQLMDSPELRHQMGERARTRALSLQWANTTDAYLQVYEKLSQTAVAHS